MARFLLASALGALIWAISAANFGEVGLIAGAVFGFGGFYIAHAYLIRRAEDRLTREKWKDYE